MSDQKVPDAPNYAPIISAYNSIADHATTQGDAAYSWAKNQVANNQQTVDQVNKGDLQTQDTFQKGGADALGRSTANINDATGYDRSERDRFNDPNYRANDMGAAEATTGAAMDAARNSSIQELESFGVNPGATRFAGLDAGIRTQRAAAQAAAGTTANNTDQARADQANDKILAQGNADAGQATNDATVGTGAGGAAVSNGTAQTASGANVLGTDLAWTGAKSNALNGQTSATNTGFQNSADADKIANSSSSGIGSLLGIGASMLGKGGALASGGALAGLALAEGGTVPDGNSGGAIPDSASPSGGAVTDDIPAQAPGVPNIRLNGGEIIIPKDVASYFGEKFFLDQINKARKSMPSGQAQQGRPKMGPAVGGPQPQPAVG